VLNFINRLFRNATSTSRRPPDDGPASGTPVGGEIYCHEALDPSLVLSHETATASHSPEQYSWQFPAEWSQTWEITGPDPFEPGRINQFVDEVRNGDLVWFDRSAPGVTLIRVLPPGPLNGAFEGVYRIELGSKPGLIRLVAASEKLP
jgi:hypothetical protein